MPLLPRIETANSLPLSEFRVVYFPAASTPTSSTFTSTSTSTSASALNCTSTGTNSPITQISTPQANYDVTLETSSSISSHDLQRCFELIAHTSASAYRASGLGWTPHKKRQEMRLPDLRYLVVKRSVGRRVDGGDGDEGVDGDGDGDGDGDEEADADVDVDMEVEVEVEVEGFCSFMLTYEDGHEVVYCYEVHLAPRARGSGIGKMLMGWVEGVGRQVGVEKAMLTVFMENLGARRFYEGLGYEMDEYSPRARRLRGGVLKKPTYVILSKSLQGGDDVG